MPAPLRLLTLALCSACALTGAWVLSGASPAFAQNYSRTLNEVRVALADGQELLTLTFSAPVEDNPIEEHQPGSFRLRFSATGSKVSNNLFQLKEQSLIQDYRVIPTAYATEVHVALRDPRQNLQGRLGFERNNNVLLVRLPAGPVARPGAAADQAMLAQAERRLSGDTLPPGAAAAPATAPSAASGAPAPLGKADSATALDEGWLKTLVTMAVALAIVLGLLYALVWAYNRYLAGRLGSRMNQYPIRHLGSFAVGPRQRIVILDINGEVIACGVTPQHISLVARLSGTRPAAPARKPAAITAATAPSAGGAPVPVASSVPVVKEPGSKDSGKDPVHTFAETLKEKVRSLKRLK